MANLTPLSWITKNSSSTDWNAVLRDPVKEPVKAFRVKVKVKEQPIVIKLTNSIQSL